MEGLNPNTIPLHQWINGAVECTNDQCNGATASHHDPKSQALSSDAFVLSALKVARSLAEQVRQSQHEPQDFKRSRSTLPMPGSTSWAENVTVHLNSPSFNCDDFITDNQLATKHEHGGEEDIHYGHESLQPLQFQVDEEEAASPEELQAMLRSMVGNPSIFERPESPVGYLSVASAKLEIMAPDYTSDNGGFIDSGGDQLRKKKDKLEQIFSLGLVFYQIFSGGEKLQIGPDNDKLSNKGEEEEEKVPLNDQAGPIDMASALNLSVALESLESAEGVDNHFGRKKGRQNAQDNVEERTKKNPSQAPVVANGEVNLKSMENLKSKGVRLSICNLIASMVDCLNGDLSSDESYNSISDVCDDLQWMSDKPRTYLDDLDLVKLSAAGLQLRETEFGRASEFATLRSIYQRSIAGGSELAIISGTSGTGKSVFAHRLGRSITRDGGYFLSGKFDQMQQAVPFAAISAALNQYIDILTEEGDADRLVVVGTELKRVLGNEAIHLLGLIPSLSAVISQQDSHTGIYRGCVDAQKRLQHLICQFVEVVSSASGVPVTLFLDDLQWADQASIEIIQHLLISGTSNENKLFFFLGSVRVEEEVDGPHPVLDMISSVRQFGIQATTIKLSSIDQDRINLIISEVLCLSPRLTRSLSNIVYFKTKGNFLFFSQLMIALSKDGLLRLSLSRCRWVWDLDKIQSRELPDDVAKFMMRNIGQLAKEMQVALSLLACFGASTKLKIIEALEKQLQITLITHLENAVEEGLLSKISESYNFSHDRLQEAAYNMMRPEECCLFHFKYGIALVSCYLESKDDGILFIATSQLNRGGPSAIDHQEQAVLVASLNLTAGNKAMEMSDFLSAYTYFDNGITFLPKKHWAEHYTLSLNMFDNAAKCALAIGNHISFTYVSEKILTFAQSFEDKLGILFLTITALSRHKPLKAVEKAMSVLSFLGEKFAGSYTEVDTELLIEQTKNLVERLSDEDLLEYKMMEDPSKIMAMKILAKLEQLTQITRPSWQPIVTLKMVQLSLSYGYSPMSPLSFTYYGMLLARRGSIREGYSYVKIGRKLLDRIGYNEASGEVIIMGTQIRCFVEPVQSANEFFLQGHDAAMSAGDMHNAIMSSFMYSVGSYWAGTKLEIVRENFKASRRLMEKHNNLTLLDLQAPVERSMLMMIGTDESELPVKASESSLLSTMLIRFNEVYQTFMFREYEQVKVLAEQYFSYDPTSWSLLYAHTTQAFMSGLVAFWVLRKTNDCIWAERGQKAKLAMNKWAHSSVHNFQHKVYLLEAEEAFCLNDFDSAKSLYEKSISFAKKHRFINEEALALELAGHFFLEMEIETTAVEYFLQAHEKYHAWGAVAKANALFGFVQRAFVPSPKVGPITE